MTKMAVKWLKSIPYLWPKRLKNHTLWGGTYITHISKPKYPPGFGYTVLISKFNVNLAKKLEFPLPNFAWPGQVSGCSFNDLVGRWLAWSLEWMYEWMKEGKLLAQKDNFLDWMARFLSLVLTCLLNNYTHSLNLGEQTIAIASGIISW